MLMTDNTLCKTYTAVTSKPLSVLRCQPGGEEREVDFWPPAGIGEYMEPDRFNKSYS